MQKQFELLEVRVIEGSSYFLFFIFYSIYLMLEGYKIVLNYRDFTVYICGVVTLKLLFTIDRTHPDGTRWKMTSTSYVNNRLANIPKKNIFLHQILV